MVKVASTLHIEQYYVGEDPQHGEKPDIACPAKCGHYDMTVDDKGDRDTDLDLSLEDFSPLTGAEKQVNEGDDAMNICCSEADGKGFYATDTSDSEMTDVTISEQGADERPAKKSKAPMPPMTRERRLLLRGQRRRQLQRLYHTR